MWNLFGSKEKSSLPEATPLQVQRAKQIEQLKSVNENVSEIRRDLEYRVNANVNGTSLALNITLPPRFPQDKPLVKVSPPVIHSWVGDQMFITGSQGLNNFVVHSDLGSVIKEIVDELKSNPPTLLGHTERMNPSFAPYPATHPSSDAAANSPWMQMPMPPSLSSMSTSHTNSQYPQLPSGPMGCYRLPDIPSSFSTIQEKSNSELQELLDNEDLLLEIISNLPEVQQISKDRQQLCDENTQLAKDNLTKKPILEDKKRILLEKFDELNELRETFDKSSQKQDALRDAYNLHSLEEQMKIAAIQAEEEAEIIAENFLEGKITVEEFKKQYLQTRTLGHSRRAKEEKIAKMISGINPTY